MRGIECLGEQWNYYVDYGQVKRYTASHASYGRRVVTKSGLVYEGCLKQDASERFWCDFSANRSKPSRLTPNRSSQYFWQVLRNWSSYQATTTAACAADVVGLWVGATELHDVAIDCVEAGPYSPQ